MLDFSQVNLLAVLAAAASAFLLGGVWYSPVLFGRVWCREAGVDMAKAGHPAKVFGGAFVMALVASGLMAILPGATPSPMQGLHMGLLVGAGFVATSFGINYLFAQRSLVMWLIDGGYHIGQFALIGLILGAWR